MFGPRSEKTTEKNTLEAIRDSYFFVLLFLIHIIVRLSPLILFLSMGLGMLAATFMDIRNSAAAARPDGVGRGRRWRCLGRCKVLPVVSHCWVSTFNILPTIAYTYPMI